jgi:hypothetical protein
MRVNVRMCVRSGRMPPCSSAAVLWTPPSPSLSPSLSCALLLLRSILIPIAIAIAVAHSQCCALSPLLFPPPSPLSAVVMRARPSLCVSLCGGRSLRSAYLADCLRIGLPPPPSGLLCCLCCCAAVRVCMSVNDSVLTATPVLLLLLLLLCCCCAAACLLIAVHTYASPSDAQASAI